MGWEARNVWASHGFHVNTVSFETHRHFGNSDQLFILSNRRSFAPTDNRFGFSKVSIWRKRNHRTTAFLEPICDVLFHFHRLLNS